MTDLPTLLSRATTWPWAATEMKNDFCIHPASEPAGYQRRIADVIYWSQHHTGHKSNPLHADAEANAALIALAPQLAEALIEAHKAMTELQRDMLELSRAGIDAIHGEEYRIVNAGRTAWHDFCATLTRIDAIMKPGGGALKGD